MKKAFIALSIATALLTGCQSEQEKIAEQKAEMKTVGSFKEVKIIDKKYVNHAKMADEFLIMVEKNEQKVQLHARGEESFNALQIDNIVTISYNKDFYINNIIFEKMEETKND